jgi:hypothetical protein
MSFLEKDTQTLLDRIRLKITAIAKSGGQLSCQQKDNISALNATKRFFADSGFESIWLGISRHKIGIVTRYIGPIIKSPELQTYAMQHLHGAAKADTSKVVNTWRSKGFPDVALADVSKHGKRSNILLFRVKNS